MTGIKEFKLDDRAVAYIRHCLALGKTLAQELLAIHDFHKGSIKTFLPAVVDHRALFEFDTGGKLQQPGSEQYKFARLPNGSLRRMRPIPTTDAYLANFIKSFLRIRSNNLCLFEDANAKSTDPFLSKIDTDFFVCGDSVYHFCVGSVDDEKIARTIKRVHSWLTIGALSSASTKIVKGRQFPEDKLKAIASAAETVIIGAYDGESYLVWNRYL